MPEIRKYETQFFDALRDIFVGAKVEGNSGYINLMRIKSNYYTKGVFPLLKQEIDKALQPFPDFREELFDKLYTFFHRYFSESGSIYFRYTSLHQNVYEKVYTDDRDVMLFWKTHMLYYVKTDRIFVSLNVEMDECKFFFDASKMELKKSNEKREVIYAFRSLAEDGTLVFDVAYSERGRTTKMDDILKDLRKSGQQLTDDTLTRAFRVFEKQSEVDYFINKNARAFLQEQFDLWLYQYLFAGQNFWSAERLAQLQALKAIAYKIIDFISQFEDELVKIWNKPKFVRNSHYIITLDYIMRDEELLKRILAHPNMPAQLQEWRDLGFIDLDFKLEMITATDLAGTLVHSKYQYLSLDTNYYPDLELDILALFDDLDASLDGWLIHSENYQSLVSLFNKYHHSINCIHIDPPYNTETSGFLYVNKYQHASWLCMMENRIQVAFNYLNDRGSFLIHVDENEFDYLSSYLRSLNFYFQGTVIWDKKNPMMGGKGIAIQHEYIMWCSQHKGTFDTSSANSKLIIQKAHEITTKFGGVNQDSRREFSEWIKNNEGLSGGERSYQFLDDDGRVYQSVGMGWPNPNLPPEQFFIPINHPITGKECPVPPRGWSRSPQKIQELINKNEIIFGPDEKTQPRRKIFLNSETNRPISSVIQNGQKGKSELDRLGLVFSYCHPTSLYENIIFGSLNGNDSGLVMDYFAGSGTTAHAVMNLNREDGGNRKYLLVEMGDQFFSVTIPRIKKVAFSDKWKESLPSGGQGMSQFAKYYNFEQYEETLHRAHYGESDLFSNPYEDPFHAYIFLRDEKMLAALEVDTANNTVHLHPERIYPDIDLAETISQRRGKWIKRITKEFVEFEDGEKQSLTDPDWQILKPLIWW